MIRLICLAIGAFGLLAVAGAARGDKYQDKKIMPKHENLNVWVSSERVGTEFNFYWPVKVEHVNGQWLWISDDGSHNIEQQADEKWIHRPIEGWVSKNDVILLEDDPIEHKGAIDYFNERLRDDSGDGWAYWQRGLLFSDKGNWRPAISDLNAAIAHLPNLYDAYAELGLCESKQALIEHADIFDKVRHHEISYLNRPDVPPLIESAVIHFRMAARKLPRPHVFADWGVALSIQDWNEFQRRIFIYYLEDPEQFENTIAQSKQLDPFRDDGGPDDGSHNALCLYTKAISAFPSYAKGHYYRGSLYEYIADCRVRQMVNSKDWKSWTNFDNIKKAEEDLRQGKAKADKLTEDLHPVADEMERLLKLPATSDVSWRIHQLNSKWKAAQREIDTITANNEKLESDLTKHFDAIKTNQDDIRKIQESLYRKIQPLVQISVEEFCKAIIEDPTLDPPYTHAAAMLLMLHDPTGLQPLVNSKDYDHSDLVEIAKSQAETGAKQFQYDNMHALATLAAALNSNGDYEGAIRREKSALEKMNMDEKKTAMLYYELYKRNKELSDKKGK